MAKRRWIIGVSKVNITIYDTEDCTLALLFSYKTKKTILFFKIERVLDKDERTNSELSYLCRWLQKREFYDVIELKKVFEKDCLKSFLTDYKIPLPIPKIKTYHTFNSLICEIRKRAKNKKFDFNIDSEYLQNLYEKQQKKCALTGLPLSFNKKNLYKISVDRLDSNKGYVKGNIQFVCLGINYLKNTFNNEEVVGFLREIKNNGKINLNFNTNINE